MVYSPIEDWSNDDVWLFLMQLQESVGAHEQVTARHVPGCVGGRRGMPPSRRYDDAQLRNESVRMLGVYRRR